LGTIQLHGQEPVAYCQELRQRWGRGEIIKAARIRSQEDLGAIAAYGHGVDALLLDAYHPHMLGGSGHTLPWPELVDFAPAIPWFLAGGLTPDNITTALGQLQPQGIDLSSGVEVAPGHKNLAQVERLFSQIRPWFGAGNSCY
jgi:phosphoribosylanthranilate isomerase